MYGVSLLVEAAIQGHQSEIVDAVAAWTAESGISLSREVLQDLLERSLPLTVDGVAEDLRAVFEGLEPEDRARFDGFPTDIENLREGPAASSLEHLAIDRYVQARADDAFSARYRELSTAADDGAFANGLWVTCSLELPAVLGTQQFPVYCHAARNKRGDWMHLRERTYLRTVESGVEWHGVVPGRVTSGYRNSYQQDRVKYFWDSVGFCNSFAYAVMVAVGEKQRYVAKSVKALEQHELILDQALQLILGAVGSSAVAALTAVGVAPIAAAPVIRAASTLITALVQAIKHRAITALSDVELSTWMVFQTVVQNDVGMPLTVFTLARPDGMSPKLSRLHRSTPAAATSGLPVVVDDDYDVEPGFHQQARFMMGTTWRPGSGPTPQLIERTASITKPVCWSDPETDEGGFRLLLPHYSSTNTARYVTAIRAETNREGVDVPFAS